MKIRDLLLIAGTFVLPYALEPLQGARAYALDVCCSESTACPSGYVCSSPSGGQECSPDAPGYCNPSQESQP
jgi:hypothetical protein